ncbi:DNA binding protein [Gautieria morchelliformis]|nr:DNA binding protein [Gautieria morchelliformis]
MASSSQVKLPHPRSPSPPPGPLPIRRLEESLINRIAAGEIIHRPASALKELLENSLDAGSTSIRVTVKDGGLKLLQIQDNGCGIRKSDLPLLASRFATSKLTTFSDLSSLQTYGFRGEALASISHVAHLSVVTKVKGDDCAWKAHYVDGVLAPPKPGFTADPRPCAGNDGSSITAEDLFHSTPLRLSALKSPSEEYTRILDVMTKYSIHNPSVSFVCKKASSTSPDLSTPSDSTTPQTIRLLYGSNVGKELIHVEATASSTKAKSKDKGRRRRGSKAEQTKEGTKGKGKARDCSAEDGDDEDNAVAEEVSDSDMEQDAAVAWKAHAYVTGVNYHVKKMVFLLFINNRLVESPRIKRAIEAVYNGVLPKGTCPFVYLSLHIDPQSVDVNVHPTKREVHFLDEESVTQRVCDAIQEVLVANSGSRTFQYQTLLTGGMLDDKDAGERTERDPGEVDLPENSSIQTQRKIYSNQKVRTSTQDRTLDSMFPVINPSQAPATSSPAEPSRKINIKESACILTSVQSLRSDILKRRHSSLTEIIEKHIFVGIVDLNRSLSLLQHATKLYLVNHGALAEELFYQLGLRQFGNFGRFRLDPPAPLRSLISLAVDNEDSIEKNGLAKDEVTDAIFSIISGRRDMLSEYFSLSINAADEIETLPLLLQDYIPNLDKLPLFLMRLGPQVNWMDERDCFDSFLRELAFFYVPGPLIPVTSNAEDHMPEEKSEKWQIQHVVFPAMRKYLNAPKTLLERDVVQVASLPDLYKVFERC